jgi:hypothetical protein
MPTKPLSVLPILAARKGWQHSMIDRIGHSRSISDHPTGQKLTICRVLAVIVDGHGSFGLKLIEGELLRDSHLSHGMTELRNHFVAVPDGFTVTLWLNHLPVDSLKLTSALYR